MNINRFRMTASELAMGRYMRAPDHPVVEEPPVVVVDPAPAAPAEPAAAVEPDPNEVFDNAFANFTEPEPKEPAAPAAPAAAEPPAAPVEPVEPPAAAAPEPAPAAPAENPDDVLKRLAEAIAKQPAPAPVEPAAPALAAVEDKPLYTADEQAVLTKFQEDWPDVAQGMTLTNRQFGKDLIEYVFNQVAPEVRAVKELVSTLALRAHQMDLAETVGDYTDAEVDSIKGWVKTQPAYLQGAMDNVIKAGTADEVADLVNRYREATGTQPAPVAPAVPAPNGGDTELSGAAKQAVAALAPVRSKRSVVQDPEDKSDFDAAWGRFADQI